MRRHALFATAGFAICVVSILGLSGLSAKQSVAAIYILFLLSVAVILASIRRYKPKSLIALIMVPFGSGDTRGLQRLLWIASAGSLLAVFPSYSRAESFSDVSHFALFLIISAALAYDVISYLRDPQPDPTSASRTTARINSAREK
ncbi:hypothetical protein OE766_20595 [Pararhizobium sp. YC-54]|uniref:hypothetical protein n=1 Tax=Pararhizobium sp. YC-54 TaxID=2986920 RepID=UPI0021F6F70E|nr:hypothetical protein [Pararhizobium sp. YC-54]MCW0000633.1 hypothetical protein [Pararhizobium sp. YC-54]